MNMNLKERRILARFRCGNECKGKEYWKTKEEIRCRICEEEEEDLTNGLKNCKATKCEKTVEETLDQEAKELEILRLVNRERKKKGEYEKVPKE